MPQEPWPPEKVARLGFLMGLGKKAEEIAADPAFNMNERALRRQASRLALAFRDVEVTTSFSSSAAVTFAAAAKRRGVSRQELLNRVVELLGAEPVMLENVLDDQCEAVA